MRLLVDFVLNRSIEHQFTPFATGFNQVVSGNAFSLVKGEEVELLVRGSLEPLDIDQLKAVTVYEGFSGEDDPTVVYVSIPPKTVSSMLHMTLSPLFLFILRPSDSSGKSSRRWTLKSNISF